jgi:hypothetical protein
VTGEPDAQIRAPDDAVLGGRCVAAGRASAAGDHAARDYAAARALATVVVWRKTLQHVCSQDPETGSGAVCMDPEHRRDADYRAHMLDILGLDAHYPQFGEQEWQECLVVHPVQEDSG